MQSYKNDFVFLQISAGWNVNKNLYLAGENVVRCHVSVTALHQILYEEELL